MDEKLKQTMGVLQRRGIIIVGPHEKELLHQAVGLVHPPSIVQTQPSRQQKHESAVEAAFKQVSKQFPDRPRAWRRRQARAWAKRPSKIKGVS